MNVKELCEVIAKETGYTAKAIYKKRDRLRETGLFKVGVTRAEIFEIIESPTMTLIFEDEPTIDILAEQLGISHRTVRKYQRDLEKHGLFKGALSDMEVRFAKVVLEKSVKNLSQEIGAARWFVKVVGSMERAKQILNLLSSSEELIA